MFNKLLPWRHLHKNGIRTRRLSVIFLTTILSLVPGWFFVHLGGQITLREIESDLEKHLVTTAALISQALSRPMTVVKLMAVEDDLLRVLSAPQSTEAVAAANRLMDRYKEISEVSVTALYTAEGRALATYKAGLAFLGSDFSFRPYIRNALEGRDFQYFALGHKEKRRGYYASTPVRHPEDGRILGVAMVKNEINEDLVGLEQLDNGQAG